MLKFEIDQAFIKQLATEVATQAMEVMKEELKASHHDLPVVLTREEAMKILRCGPTKMAELMNRPDFPVSREFGVKIPSHMLLKWIEKNTRWVEDNTGYFDKAI